MSDRQLESMHIGAAVGRRQQEKENKIPRVYQ